MCETYHLALIQINPNAYTTIITLYIIYKEEGFGTLDTKTLDYFFN